jgi:hypothetical protein
MGGGTNQQDMAIAKDNNQTQEVVSTDDTAAQKDMMTQRCQADEKVAQITADAEVEKSKNELAAVQDQDKANIEIAKMEYEVEMEKAKNDALRINTVETVNAKANTMSAQAEIDKADADKIKAEGQAAKDMNSGGSSDYSSFYS